MNDRRRVAAVSHFWHAHFLWPLLGSYVAAALWPGFGLWIRDLCLGEVGFAGERSRGTLPTLMLALLLINAGLGAKVSRLRNLLGSAPPLAAGLRARPRSRSRLKRRLCVLLFVPYGSIKSA